MIERMKNRTFEMSCDECGNYLIVEDVYDFQEGIKAAKEKGWKMKMVDGLWEHYCPCCKK